MEFRTERTTVRHWRASDSADLYECARDPEVASSAGWLPHSSESESSDVIRNVLTREECYAVCIDGRAVGCIEVYDSMCSNLGLSENEFEMGIWIRRDLWHEGYMAEAMSPVVDHVFSDLRGDVLLLTAYDGAGYVHDAAKELGFVASSSGPLPELCSDKCRHGTVYRHTSDSWHARVVGNH